MNRHQLPEPLLKSLYEAALHDAHWSSASGLLEEALGVKCS